MSSPALLQLCTFFWMMALGRLAALQTDAHGAHVRSKKTSGWAQSWAMYWAWPGTLAVRYCILDCICPAAQDNSDRDIVEVCGESGILVWSTLDDYAWGSRVFVAIYCNFLLPILDMSIIIKNTRSVALEGQSVKSKFHLSLMISQIRLTNCRLPAAASQVWRTKFRVQGPQRLLGSDTWRSRLTENYKVRFCKLSKCRVT